MKRSPVLSFEKEFSTAISLLKKGNPQEAKRHLLAAQKINSKASEVYINLGAISYSENDWRQAEAYFRKAISLTPIDPISIYNLGLALHKQGRLLEAKKNLEKASLINPRNDNALNQLGTVLNDLEQPRKAVVVFEKALAVNPNNTLALYNMGRTLDLARNTKAAIPYLKKAFELNPTDSRPLSLIFAYYRSICDWEKAKKYSKQLTKLTVKDLAEGSFPGENPFMNVTRVTDPEMNLGVAKAWSLHIESGISKVSRFKFSKQRKGRIRIGYASDGFRDFPTTHNITGVFENHDRGKFKIYAYSFGPDDKSIFRKRVIRAVDKFVDVKEKNAYQIARQINKDSIDILVDLKGFTQGAKPEIAALKPAPIIISMLGFIGSSGSNYHDYFIGDKTVLPPTLSRYFSEKIIYMPHSYWPTDDQLKVSDIKYKKSQFGIPEKAFVFASFNQTYKVEEEIFDTWLRIIKRVPGSILWIYAHDEEARLNLLNYTKKIGISAKRIIIAGDLPKEKHLARIKDIVDIALDTGIVNGHTTTTDCLWVGVPVISLLGKHFASRVSASMLGAIGLPELVTKNLKDYEDKAVMLANNPKKLLSLKQELNSHIKSRPLFDTNLYTRHLENAFLAIYKRYLEGKAPTAIIVQR